MKESIRLNLCPLLDAISKQRCNFVNSNLTFMEKYIKKAADAFLVERPYGMRVDYRKKGYVLFNRSLNLLGKVEPACLEELPLERFEVEEIPLLYGCVLLQRSDQSLCRIYCESEESQDL